MPENDFFSCLGFVFMQSFRLYHLFPLASRWEWMKCGIFCLCFFAWDFCLRFLFGGCFAGCYLLAMGLPAYFSTFTPTLWVCPLTFLLPRPRRGFSRLLFYFHAQFPLPDISISFRDGLFCLLFTPYAHAVGFPAYFPTPTPTPWVFPLIFLLSRPVSAPRHID